MAIFPIRSPEVLPRGLQRLIAAMPESNHMVTKTNDRRIRAFLIIAAVLAFPRQASAAIAESWPLPPRRPAEAPLHPAPHDTAPGEQAEPKPSIDQACLDRLRAAGIEFEMVTLPPAPKPGCSIETPVRLKAVIFAPRWKTSIHLPDEPTLSCRFGERFGHWLRDLVAPLIAGELGVELKSVRTGPGYECRNRAEAGKISAHASGLAADVVSFELANGRTLPIKPNDDEHLRATVDAIRVAACGWFTTVLGPGSDAAHADHMHVDSLQHGSSDRYRICL
ncbi:extensin family protein (plasmid) [Methylocapsa polymorpha]|uniref:Extensin family protein n=1 Tax=Methylocapsa polymorpha TaxID=3080828 RepID=A0ABZ0HWS8_9HYPH|nr:extensin family protein [Methylocapsa sp. RX1]WOJ91693.1 extensin family protein [Methylocapsa sp. RX1]